MMELRLQLSKAFYKAQLMQQLMTAEQVEILTIQQELHLN